MCHQVYSYQFLLADDNLDYLTFNGSQYFYIEKPSTPTKLTLEMVLEPDTLSHSQPTFFGGTGSGVQIYRNGTTKLAAWTSSGSFVFGEFNANTRNTLIVEFTASQDKAILNGRTTSSSASKMYNKLFATGCTRFTVGAYNDSDFRFYGKIYSVKMYADNVLIHDLIPKGNKSSKYFFDNVSGDKYYSQGSSF